MPVQCESGGGSAGGLCGRKELRPESDDGNRRTSKLLAALSELQVLAYLARGPLPCCLLVVVAGQQLSASPELVSVASRLYSPRRLRPSLICLGEGRAILSPGKLLKLERTMVPAPDGVDMSVTAGCCTAVAAVELPLE